MPTPIARYKALLQSGRFQPDAAQARAAQALERLYRELKDYRPGRDDLEAALRALARDGHGHRRNLEHSARPALRGRPQSRTLPLVHRDDRGTSRGDRAEWSARLSARANGWAQTLLDAARARSRRGDGRCL